MGVDRYYQAIPPSSEWVSKFVAAIATASGDSVRLVKFEHPRQTELFLEQLSILTEGGRKPTVVMESTGTYGDAVRYRCHQRGMARLGSLLDLGRDL